MTATLPTTPAAAPIDLQDVTRSYGDVAALRGTTFQVRAGEIFGLLGQNGSGKSTTVRIIATLLQPSGGTARVHGHDVTTDAAEVRQLIGTTLQETCLDGLQTGAELLQVQARLHGASRRQARVQLDDVRDLLGLGDVLDQRISRYSGGMRRRIDLAAAIIHRPRVLILDEPTVGLDPESRLRLWDEVLALRTDLGMSILLTTQYLEEADRLCDRVAIMGRGQVVVEGAPDELKRRHGSDSVIIGGAADPGLAHAIVTDLVPAGRAARDADRVWATTDDAARLIGPLATALDRAGVRFETLEITRATLDEVYFAHALPEGQA